MIVRPAHLGAAALGVAAGVLAAVALTAPAAQPRLAHAASLDRYQDYILCTGAVSLSARQQLDGVWMIDYKAGKLLGTVIDKSQGKITGFAEVDLVTEFDVTPRQDVHFLMTTGYITAGQAALYVAETVTGKFGVYTMAGGPNGQGVVIRRHDMTSFRKTADAPPAGKAADGPGLPPAAGDPAVPPAPAAPPIPAAGGK